MRLIAIALVTHILICAHCSQAADLKAFTGVRYVANPSNDGDSFAVSAGGKEYIVRLYFVDSPESSADSDTDARRVREQLRYFGLPGPAETVGLGQEAGKFTEKALFWQGRGEGVDRPVAQARCADLYEGWVGATSPSSPAHP